MNVLIISTNRNAYPLAVMPLGACLVAEAAERAGHNVRLLDLMFKKEPLSAVVDALENLPADVIGLSVRNIDNNDMNSPVAFFKELLPLIDTVRRHSRARLVLGGAAVGVMPEAYLRYTGVPYAVTGNGESSFPLLLERLAAGADVRDVPGLNWIEDGGFRSNEPDRSSWSSACRVPDFGRWIDANAYLARLSTVPVQTKRGCPYKCVYCTYGISEGREYQLCSPESVVAAAKRLVARDLKDIEFVDNVFNSPYSHAMEICGEFARARLGARLQSLELNPRFVDGELLTAMEEAGFVGIGITAESASDLVLRSLGKDFDTDELSAAAEAVWRSRLPCMWIFMVGGPGETESSVEETLRFAKECVRPTDVAFFNIGVRVYPGTELEGIARREGVLRLPPKDMFDPVTYVSPRLDPVWLTRRVRSEVLKEAHFLDSDSLSYSFLPLLCRIGHGIGFGHPIWKHTRLLKKSLRLLGAQV